jgi:hypothetical protein
MIKLSQADLVLLQNATRVKREADAIFQFVSQHLNNVYEIPTGSPINMLTGKVEKPDAHSK